MTITTKTLITTKDKRGNERYYKVDAKGKKIRLTGLEYVTQIAYLMKEQNELKHAEIDAIDDYIVTTDAQNSAVDAEIDNANNNDVVNKREIACREYDEFQTAAKLIAADVEHIESLRDCCKPNSARHQFYNQILKDSDAPIKEFNKKYCDAIDRYNKSLLPTDTERQAAKNAVEDIKADYAARGIKFIAKVYYFPHGVEGEPMEVFSCECKSWLDAVEFVNREFIDGQYVDGIYFAGNVIENIDGDVIPPPYDLESPDVDTDAETYSYKTNRGNIRTLKVGETGSNVKSRWYYYHEIAGLPESGVIELSIDSNGDDFTNQLCKFIATDTDGSEDDIDDDIFDLLPTVDELNDVSEFAPVQSIISTKVIVDDEGNEFKHVLIGEERISYLNGEINNIYSGKYRAWFDYYFSRYGIQYTKGGVTCGAKSFGDEEEFFSEMERRGACSIDKPESTTLDTLAAIAETCQNLNANAPEGWEIYFDTENNFFPIEFNGKQVTKLDSLATQNFLSPQKFFERFRPLVDKNYTPKQQFIDERLLELDNLQAMRVEIGNDTERLKILDDLIEQTKRDICELEFAS